MHTVTRPADETPYLPLLPTDSPARIAIFERALKRAERALKRAAAELGLPLP